MESFFLAETTKYLYLLFDPDNIINNNGGTGTIIETPNGECIIETGAYIFNTEAHPIDMGALSCCYDVPQQNLLADYDTAKFQGDIFEYSVNEDESKYRKYDHLPSSNVTVNIQTKIDPEETRKNIVAEIMNVLKENKQNREKLQNTASVDDSIILPIDVKKEKMEIEEPVEIVKLPPARDSDDNKSSIQKAIPTDFVTYDEVNASTEAPAAISTTTEQNLQNLNSTQLKTIFNQEKYLDENVANTSMLSEFVHSILKSTLPSKPKFNPQTLLEKIRANGYNRNLTQNYNLLTCKAQPYLQRITVLGEFF